MNAMRAGGMGGGEADVGILEGDAALGRHAEPAGRFEIDVGRGLGVLDVVARGDGGEAVEQAGAPEMALGRGPAGAEVATASGRPRPARKSSSSTTPGFTGMWSSQALPGMAREAVAELVDAEAGAIEVPGS